MEEYSICNSIVQNLPDKCNLTFVNFDVVEFYPSITEAILLEALEFAEQHTKFSKPDIEVILHARRSLLFTKNKPWIKCTGSWYDVAMGSSDGAEIC